MKCLRCHRHGRERKAEFEIRNLESGEVKPLCSLCMIVMCGDMVVEFLQRAEKLDEK